MGRKKTLCLLIHHCLEDTCEFYLKNDNAEKYRWLNFAFSQLFLLHVNYMGRGGKNVACKKTILLSRDSKIYI